MEIKSLKVIDGQLHNISHELNRFELFPNPKSPNVDYMGFDRKAEELYVQFKNGLSYIYLNVPADAMDKWSSEHSAGNYLANEIKGEYRYSRVDWYAEVANLESVAETYKKLLHHRDTTVGLCATDRPDMIVDEKGILFQIS